MNLRQNATTLAPVAIVLMSNVIAAIGLRHAGFGWDRVAVLLGFLATFTWLLSESLELVMMRAGFAKWKATATAIFAFFLACVEVWVHHYGALWLFGDNTPLVMQYAAAAGFVFATVTAKWLYMTGDKVPEPATESPVLPTDLNIEVINYATDGAQVVAFPTYRGDLDAVADRLEQVVGTGA